MSTRPSKNYPPELRERAIRMVAEIRSEYTSDWTAVCSVAIKLGIGSPQTPMNWVRKAQVDAGQRGGVTSAEAAELRRLRAEVKQLRTANEILHTASACRGGARPPTGLIVDCIDAHRQKFRVVPICRVLTEHGMPIAPSTFYDALRRRVSGPLPAQVRDEELCGHIALVHAESFGVYGARKVWLIHLGQRAPALESEATYMARAEAFRELAKSAGRSRTLAEWTATCGSSASEEGKQALDRWISWARRCRIPVFVDLAGLPGRTKHPRISQSGPFLVHMNGWQRSFQPSMNRLMAATRSLTLVKVPRRIAWRVVMPKNMWFRWSSLDAMKGRGLPLLVVPGECWGCHVQHDVGGPYE
jgi:transposase